MVYIYCQMVIPEFQQKDIYQKKYKLSGAILNLLVLSQKYHYLICTASVWDDVTTTGRSMVHHLILKSIHKTIFHFIGLVMNLPKPTAALHIVR